MRGRVLLAAHDRKSQPWNGLKFHIGKNGKGGGKGVTSKIIQYHGEEPTRFQYRVDKVKKKKRKKEV